MIGLKNLYRLIILDQSVTNRSVYANKAEYEMKPYPSVIDQEVLKPLYTLHQYELLFFFEKWIERAVMRQKTSIRRVIK